MKIRAILLTNILILSFMAINCQKEVAPFTPEVNTKKQSENESSTGSATKTSRTPDRAFVRKDEKSRVSSTHRDVKGDSQIHRVNPNSSVIEKSVSKLSAFEKVQDVKASQDMHSGELNAVKQESEETQELHLKVQPSEWRKEWRRSEGLVKVSIKGDGFGSVVEGSLTMDYGPCDGNGPSALNGITPVSEELRANAYVAKFTQKDAIGLIDKPKRGETHTIHVTGLLTGDIPFCLECEIMILGRKPGEGSLWLTIQPTKWNLSWDKDDGEVDGEGDGTGLVTARIRGKGFEDIVPDTVSMDLGPCPENGENTSNGIPPVFEKIGGSSYVAKFMKSEAIALIPEPKRGDTHEIHVSGELAGDDGNGNETFCLSYTIKIVGKKPEVEELTLEIKPGKWNLSWAESEDSIEAAGGDGQVKAHIRGEGFEDIDPASVQMDYPMGGLGPIDPIPDGYKVGDTSLVVKFRQSDAIGLFPDPQRGETYEIHVIGNFTGGEPFDLTYEIKIVGKKSEAEELTLEIKPKKWNLSWAESEDNGDDDDVVTARISGEGFEDIDPASVQMDFPDGGQGPIDPIADSDEFGGKHFSINFRRTDAIGLLSDPKKGDTFEIHVTGEVGGSPFDLYFTISIVGKND